MNGISIRAAMREAIQPTQLLQSVANRTLELIAGAEGVLIGLSDNQGISYLWGAGPVALFIGTRVNLDTSITGLAVRTRTVQWSNDTASDPRADLDASRRLSVASNICVPLSRGENEILGVLTATSSTAHAFSDEDVAVLTRVGEYVSGAIGLALDFSRISAQLFELTRTPGGEIEH